MRKIFFILVVFFVTANFSFTQETFDDLLLKARELIANEDYEEAKSVLKLTININPVSDEAFFLLGFVYGKLDQPLKEIEFYKSALNINPKYFDALINLGHVFNKLKKYADAIYYLNRAKEINDNDSDLYWQLGVAYCGLDQLKSSMRFYQKAVDLDPFNKDLEKEYYNIKGVLLQLKLEL